ncbi:MAG: HlyC/CorC family transporter [Oscillospiraceae bacterium]|nr:HlyC/CorC family transporter [Oscillospiraceae bacterium]
MIGLILLQIVLIGLNAIFASAELAILSINETKLERMAEEGNKRAGRLFKLTREPARFLATIQVAITLSGFLGSAFAADGFSEPLVQWLLSLGVKLPESTLDSIAVVLITLLLSYFTLVFGELVPKRVAMKRAESLGLGISGLVSGISTVFKPIVWLLSVSTNGILRLMGIDPNQVDEQVNEEEILMMVDAGSEKGAIDRQEKEFIQNVFAFDDLTAEEIAVHRMDVTFLWMEDSMDSWARTIHDSRHTLYPVCKDSADHVIGILNAKDYFRLDDKSRESVMRHAVKEPFFVPETIKADVLFRQMKKTRNIMAVVLDEHGGMEGIVTLNDLVEQLVGDLGEDTPEEAAAVPHVEQMDGNTWAIIGNAELYDIEQALNVEIGLEEVDTFTGLVFGALDMVPGDGEQNIELDFKGLHIHIRKVENHQISYATVTKLRDADDGDDPK